MTRSAEPEREMVRRAMPFALPAFGLALLIGVLAGGWDAGWSAAIGVGVVFVNLMASGLSLAWAARISLQALSAVAIGGFIVRMGAIFGLMLLLDRIAFFSPLAFFLAVAPATLALLGYEMKLLSRGVSNPTVGVAGGGPPR
jgi:hypothetical protein